MLLPDQLWIELQKTLTFDRSGNNEFKNFLIIAKGSNGEFRSQLYRYLDKKHIIQERFNELYVKKGTPGNKIMSFIT